MQTPTIPPGAEGSSTKFPPLQEMVGATSDPFHLDKGRTDVSFDLHPPTGPALLRSDGKPRRVFLKVENITSNLAAPSFDIYLNLPPTDDPQKHPDLHVGKLPTFGLVETSRSTEQHVGNGLTYTEEVTNLFHHLSSSRDWDGKTLRVSFLAPTWDYPLEVKVGRVSLIFE